jgi:hypothetical protein
MSKIVKPVKDIPKIVVLGYYNRCNLGDDSFIDAFREIFKRALAGFDYELCFIIADSIQRLPENTKLVVCGAGDIVNSYFIKKITNILENSAYVGKVSKIFKIFNSF